MNRFQKPIGGNLPPDSGLAGARLEVELRGEAPEDLTYDGAAEHLRTTWIAVRASLRSVGTHRLKDLTLPEHLYQLVHQDIGAEFPAPVTLDARPNNLPLQTTEFLGRSNELAAIEDHAFHKLLDTAKYGAQSARRMISYSARVVNALISLIAAAGVLTVLHPALLPLLVTMTLPSAWSARPRSARTFASSRRAFSNAARHPACDGGLRQAVEKSLGELAG